jgi:hypothetical protein
MSINRILYIPEWRTVATVSVPQTDFAVIYPKSDGFWYTSGSDGYEKQIAKSSTFKNGLVTTTLGTGSTITYQIDLSLGIGLSFSSDTPGSLVNVLGLTAYSLASVNQFIPGYVLSATSGGSFSWIPMSSSSISGTTNSIPKFTSTSNLGNSLMTDDGGTVFIGTNPNIVSSSFSVSGNVNFGGLVYLNNNTYNYFQNSNGIVINTNNNLVADYNTGVLSGNYFSFFNATASLLDGFVQFGSASTKYFNLPQVGEVNIGTTSNNTVVNISSATYGAISIVDTNQGNNKFLVSDSNGVGTWKMTGVFNGLTQSGLSYGIDYSIFGSTLTYSSNIVNLPTTGVVSGTYGGSSSIPIINVDQYGRLISATSVSVSLGDLQTTLTLGNTASLGFQLYDSALIDLNDSFGNTNTLGAQNIVISNSVGEQIDINTQGAVVGGTSSSLSLQKDNIVKTDIITGAETILEFNQTSLSRTIIFPDNDGTVALLSDITGGNLQQTLTLGNTSSLNIELIGGTFQSSGSGSESSALSSGGLQLIDGLNTSQVTPFSVKVESASSYIEFNDTKITKLDPSDGRYTDLVFNQTTPGGVNTITFQDGTGTVAFLTDVVSGPAGPTGPAGTFQSTLTTQSGTSYELQLSDENTIVNFDSSSSVTVTIPTYSVVPFTTNCQIQILQSGTGTVSFTWSGITVSSYSNYTTVYGQWIAVSLLNLSTDNWVILGNLK